MRYEQILATLIIALLAGTVGAYLVSAGIDPTRKNIATLDAMTEIVSSGKLRCGYIEDEPAFSKNTATGAVSGIWYALTEMIGERAKLEIVWASATTPETLVADLKARKFDALCSGFAPDLLLAKDVTASTPAYYRANKPYGFVTLAANDELRNFLSTSVGALVNEGEVEAILKKFETQPTPFQRIKPNFEPTAGIPQ